MADLDLSTPPLHEQGPVVDRAHLDRMTGGDMGLAMEVLGLFREQIELWLRLFDPQTPTPDWGIAAHTVKGSARGIGAWRLGELCGQAEEEAKDAQMPRDAKRHWREVIEIEIDQVKAAISAIEHQINLSELT